MTTKNGSTNYVVITAKERPANTQHIQFSNEWLRTAKRLQRH
ncbi:hypothetical protein [Brevibacillus sp. BC25]|nr:hypothetical protein [Brevibacillus sp. BC25]